MNVNLKHLAIFVAVNGMLGIAPAATITWGAFDNNPSSDSEVSNIGTFVEAINIVSSSDQVATGNVTINGVDFTAVDLFNNALSFDLNTEVDTESDGLDTIYSTIGILGGTISISNLTMGNTYQIQAFYGDARSCCETRRMIVGSAQFGPTESISSESADDGTWIIGTFTADATTQEFVASFDNTSTTELNAYSVRDISSLVPEPSSFVLFGVGGLACLLRRRGSP